MASCMAGAFLVSLECRLSDLLRRQPQNPSATMRQRNSCYNPLLNGEGPTDFFCIAVSQKLEVDEGFGRVGMKYHDIFKREGNMFRHVTPDLNVRN